MKLSRAERWILHNQFLILEKVDTANAKAHRQAQEALGSGYELYFDWLAEGIYPDTLPEDECNYVISVLEMYDSMQLAYDRMEDKAGIDAECVKFPGFDGNNETKHMGFAKFFCDEREAYTGLRKAHDGYNSHMPTKALYARMIPAYRESKDRFHLTKDDLVRILQASVHPDSRDRQVAADPEMN